MCARACGDAVILLTFTDVYGAFTDGCNAVLLHILLEMFLCMTVLCLYLCICVQNVTGYHAAIDGASQKLKEKTERLSLADRDLVQMADEHAEELEREATKLEE